MKTYVWTIILLCYCLWCTAQTKYEVTANTFLNIRSYADKEAPVLGTIDKGGKIDVYEINDGWAPFLWHYSSSEKAEEKRHWKMVYIPLIGYCF